MPKTYEPIATATVSSTGGTVTFSSIPSTYTDLILVSRVLRGTTGSGGGLVDVQINSDSGSNYSWTQVYGNGSSTVSSRATSTTSVFAGATPDYASGAWAVNICQFMNYSNTTTFKTAILRVNDPSNYTGAVVNLWRNTSAISSLYLNTASGFYIGSTFTLYGIKAA